MKEDKFEIIAVNASVEPIGIDIIYKKWEGERAEYRSLKVQLKEEDATHYVSSSVPYEENTLHVMLLLAGWKRLEPPKNICYVVGLILNKEIKPEGVMRFTLDEAMAIIRYIVDQVQPRRCDNSKGKRLLTSMLLDVVEGKNYPKGIERRYPHESETPCKGKIDKILFSKLRVCHDNLRVYQLLKNAGITDLQEGEFLYITADGKLVVTETEEIYKSLVCKEITICHLEELFGLEFKPYDRILTQKDASGPWTPAIFSHYDRERAQKDSRYIRCIGDTFAYSPDQCLPYEGNEHLTCQFIY